MRKIFIFLFILSVVSFCAFYIYAKQTQLYQASIQLAIFSIGGFLVWKKDLKTTLNELGIPSNIKTILVYSVAGFAVLFLGMLIIGGLAKITGFGDQQKVADKIKGLPEYILLVAIFVAPICEELLFRGYLSRKIGPILSAIAFGLVHVGYGSIVEIIGVTFIGIVFGYLYKRSGTILPGIIIHMMYNMMSILVIRFLL